MEPLRLIYEGGSKTIYRVHDSDRLVQRFRDDISACGGVKEASLEGRGELNNAISSIVFKYLENAGIKSHFLQRLNKTDMLVRGMNMIPLSVIVRNRVAGSLTNRLGLEVGQQLHNPVVELHYRRDNLGDPLLNQDHVEVLGLADREEIHRLREQALLVNEKLIDFYAFCGIRLIDAKLEFGKVWTDSSLRLGDDLSPDVCRLWDMKSGVSMDKDVFRKDLGDPLEQCGEVLNRVKAAYPDLV